MSRSDGATLLAVVLLAGVLAGRDAAKADTITKATPAGQEVNGGLIFYIPAAGFTGTDTFTFNYVWGVGNKNGYSFSPDYIATIMVK